MDWKFWGTDDKALKELQAKLKELEERQRKERKKDLEELDQKRQKEVDRLLKQLQVKQKEENEETLSNLEDKLDKKIKDFDKTNKKLEDTAKKLEKDQNDIIKELEQNQKEVNKKIDEASKKFDSTLKELADELNKDKWIIGEYKWMPIGSKMPKGWVKVDLAQGRTLVQGSKKGQTIGSILKHQHPMSNNKGDAAWGVSSPGILYGVERPITPHGVMKGQFLIFLQSKGGNSVTLYNTGDTGSDSNLAAGLFAELWQYQGVA